MKESGDVAEHKGNVTAAMATLETDLTSIETSCAGDVIPAPPGGVPKIPDHPDDAEHSGAPLPGMPATDPTGAGGTPSASSAGSGTPSASAAAGAGGAPSGAPAQPLPASAFAAPPAPATQPAAASASPAGAAPAAATEAPGGGMPMSGMPMGGMPQMSPPQMPSGGGGQTPGADVAKTVGDTVSKLAGKDGGGTPMSADTLSKLLDAQGGGGEHDGANGDGHDGKKDGAKLPEGAPDPLAKVFGNNGQQTHLLDPYSAANQNPSLNNPASPAHLQSPSPAAPVVTAAPASPTGLPMTQLSADENPVTPQQHSTVTATASASDAVTTHPSAGGPAAPPAAPAAPGAPGGGPLGAYNGAALGTPPPVGAAPPMAAPMGMGPMPMGGGMMAPPAAAGGGGGGSSATVLAAAVPAATVVEAATSGRRRAPETPARLATLAPEHIAAEQHLAGLARVFTQRSWATAVLAVACMEVRGGVRYVLATADGLSLVPLGVPLPGGVELLAEQELSPSFAADWSGHVHPARKLAAWVGEDPAAGRLVHLVSNDGAGVPAVSGAVVEARQSQAERAALGGGSPAILPRTALAATMIPAAKAADALAAFGAAWGITDATTEDWRTAPGRLWAARWDRDRPDDYPAIIATYHYVEGLEALAQGRDVDAAYSASALAAVRPYDWVAA